MAIHEWQKLTTTEFAELNHDTTLVLLPLGATEQHGAHLPVGADGMLASAVLTDTLAKLDEVDVLLLPQLWCTKSIEHMDFPGTISLRTETMIAMLEDLANSIARSGFHKLVILNWHGGNTELLGTVARDIRLRHDLLVVIVDGLRLATQVAREAAGVPSSFGLHAGRGETSMMMAAFGEDVREEALRKEHGRVSHEKIEVTERLQFQEKLSAFGDAVSVGWKAADLTSDGVIGDLEGANAVEGGNYFKLISDKIVEILRLVAAPYHMGDAQ